MPEPLPITAIQSDENLRSQMEQFFEATTDAIVFLDREYRFVFLNRRAKELVAFGRELLGKNAWEEFPGMIFPDSPFVANYTRAMEEGIPGEFDAYYPDPINKSLRIQCYPADDGIMVFFRDVTEGKSAREALQRATEEAEHQHAEIATIYDTAPIGLALFDLEDYRYLRLNDRQAAFFGLKPEQIVGKTLTEMAPIEGLKELFDQVKRGEPIVNYPLEGTLVTDPDTYRYWAVNYFPVYGSDGTIQAITAASQEITQQKKAEQALIQSEKLAAVGRLASSIAHEINNPLEAVTNLLYLARASDKLEDAHKFIDAAEVELRRVSAIVSQTLRFHKQASSPQEVQVEDLMRGVLSMYQGRIANSKVKVDSRFRALRPVRCFEGEIRQVLSNLVGNALDSMPNGGRLELRGRKATNWQTAQEGVMLTISDTGSGMSEETMKKVFNAFFTTKGMVGTGLGLWVSKEIMDRHRGTIHVRSSQLPSHHGTVFTLFLPFEAVVR